MTPCSVIVVSILGNAGFDRQTVIGECQPSVGTTDAWPIVSVGLEDSVGTELHEYWRMATGRLSYPLFNEESRYRACAYLYRRLRENPGLRTQHIELDSFYLSWQYTGLERLVLAAEKIRLGNYLTARLLNETVEPANQPEVNLRALNEACLQALTEPSDPPAPTASFWSQAVALQPYSESSRQTIRWIADQCPLAGGPAVRMARNLRTAFDGLWTAYSDSAACSQAADLKTQARQQTLTLRRPDEGSVALEVYPNPAGRQVTLDYRLPTAGAELTITDLAGQTLHTYPLDEQGRLDLSVEHWPQGLYFCVVRVAGRILLSRKLAVVH